MELKEGYKLTEVGVIPKDWEVKRLEEVSRLSSGTTPARKFEERYYSNGNIHWVKTTDLNNGAIKDTDEKITDLALNETILKIYDIGTVLVAMYGGFNQIGRTGILNIPSAINQALTAVQANRRILNSLFLINYLNYKVCYWKDVAISSRKDPNITSKDVKNFPIPLPSPFEQQAIAEALSDIDALITSLQQLISKKRNIKQGAMQELLGGNKRLAEFSEEWAEVALSKYLEFPVTYGIVTAGDFQSVGIQMLRGGDIKNGKINIDDVPLVSVEKSKEYSRTILKKNDIVIALVGYPGEVAKIPQYFEGANISRAVGLIRTNGNIDPDFLVHYLNSTKGRKLVLAPSAGSAQVVVNLKEINKLKIVIPKIEEQKAIAQILSDMHTEIEKLEQQRDKYKAIKQGMMQQLLTGKVRLV